MSCNQFLLNMDHEQKYYNNYQSGSSSGRRNRMRKITKQSSLKTATVGSSWQPQLSQAYRVELQRTSGHNPINLCEHCSHQHSRACCMYVYDSPSDIEQYAIFKAEVDKPYHIFTDNDDFNMKLGQVTPQWFPISTDNDPEGDVDISSVATIPSFKQSPPVIYLRQYIWPLFLPSHPNSQFNQLQKPESNLPCIMRQVIIQTGGGKQTHSQHQHPQIIESHSYMPIYY